MMENKKKKLERLFKDERTYFERLRRSFLPCGTLLFILIFFGPMDIYMSNVSHFGIKIVYVLIPFLIIFLVCTVFSDLMLSLLKGRLFDGICSFLIALSVCFYVQGNFLNNTLGMLDGQLVQWHFMATDACINIVVWLVIIGILYLLFYMLESERTTVANYICLIIIIMQSVALIYEAVNCEQQKGYYLSGENAYTLASDDNVIVFVLDSMTDDILRDAMGYDRQVESEFVDFTLFDNCNAEYTYTRPGLAHLLTGGEYDTSVSYNDNIRNFWNNAEPYYRIAKKAGYTLEVYSNSTNCVFGKDADCVEGIIDNVSMQKNGIIGREAVIELVRVSIYRYMPICAKACFWSYPTGEAFVDQSISQSLCDYRFIKQLRSYGLSQNNKQKKAIKIYHLEGAHEPYSVDYLGEQMISGTSEIQATAGYLRGVSEYIVGMKKLGIYDDSLIIITADHGKLGRPQCGLMVKDRNVRQDEIKIKHAPVCQSDVFPTVMRYADSDMYNVGKTLFEFDEKIPRKRKYACFSYDDNYPKVEGNNYNIVKEFEYIGNSETIKNKYAADEYDEIRVLTK